MSIQSQSTHIKTRILILSDTHSSFPQDKSEDVNSPFHSPLPRADVLLHCGDLTMVGYLHEYTKTLDMLASIDTDLKLVIAGNHDISLDEEFYHRKGPFMHRRPPYQKDNPEIAREMWKGEHAKRAGVTYLDEGTHEFVLKNGAKLRVSFPSSTFSILYPWRVLLTYSPSQVYASPYQPEFCDWAFPYFRHEDRYNPSHQCTPNATPIAQNPVPDFPAIDVMMTHGPPQGILDATDRGEHVGCGHLLRAARRCKPRLHCFGHIHEGWGAKTVKWRKDDDLDVQNGKYIHSSDKVVVDRTEMLEERAAKVDISMESGSKVNFGEDTLMVNASIMTLQYQPMNGPWLVDLDLERAT